jgi:hypothetical protein
MSGARRLLGPGGLLLLALAAAGCEDDPPPIQRPTKPAGAPGAKAPAPPGGKPGAPAPAAAAPPGKKVVGLGGYEKVPDALRRRLTEREFRPDPGGDENRDPFRSYVIHAGAGQSAAAPTVLDTTDNCNRDNSRASSYSLRDLRLIGIVLRGTRSYAQFRDSSNYGHIVARGDCLGKEKAVVETIGAGYVRLEVRPEAPPGAPAPPPQKRDIPLYPEEYQIDPEAGIAN